MVYVACFFIKLIVSEFIYIFVLINNYGKKLDRNFDSIKISKR